jgi:hypothetical protein
MLANRSAVLAAVKDEPSVALRAILDRGSARRTMGHHVGSTARDGLSKRSTML